MTKNDNSPTSLSTAGKREKTWRCTSITGLYQRFNGVFYSRYSLNGKTVWRSLETDDFAKAKLRHSTAVGRVEKARQSGQTVSTEVRTMGDLARLYEQEVLHMDVAPSTKVQYQVWLKRVRDNWDGNFDTTLPRNVDRARILAFREALKKAVYKVGGVEKTGYRPAVINQAVSALRMLMILAEQHNLVAESPFKVGGMVRQSVYLANNTRRPELPSIGDMERVFAELERMEDESTPDCPARLHLARRHLERARLARFLAYSGMRLAEAQAARWEDDQGTEMKVRGTKTESAPRTIPIIAPLRRLLDQIKQDRDTGPILTVGKCREHLAKACDKLGIKKLRHHDLRHYFATTCIEAGADIPTVADWLGHGDGGATLLDTYRHLRREHSQDAAAKVSAFLQSKTA